MGSLLYGVQVPEFGGDTLFANMYSAYSTLSPGLQTLLSGLRAVHCADRYNTSKAVHADYDYEGVVHPVVRTHPVTGRKALFVNEYFTHRFEDMTEDESRCWSICFSTALVRTSVAEYIGIPARWCSGTIVAHSTTQPMITRDSRD